MRAVRWLTVVGWVVVLSGPVCGQTLVSATSALDSDGRFQYRVKIQMPGVRQAQAVVTGAPYSGDEVVEETQPDGLVVRMEELGRRRFRDSQGRVRVEYVPCPNSGLPAMPRLTEISDPVGGFDYIVDAQNRVVHRVRRFKVGGGCGGYASRDGRAPMASASGGGGQVTANREEVEVE